MRNKAQQRVRWAVLISRRCAKRRGEAGAPVPAKSIHDNQSPEDPTRPYTANERHNTSELRAIAIWNTHNTSPASVRSDLHGHRTATVPLSCITYWLLCSCYWRYNGTEVGWDRNSVTTSVKPQQQTFNFTHYVVLNTGRFIMFCAITNIYNMKTKNAYAEPSTLLFLTSIARLLQFALISSDYAEHWPEPV
jgi:hypothetical protein